MTTADDEAMVPYIAVVSAAIFAVFGTIDPPPIARPAPVMSNPPPGLS